jgi:hypothetical protein
VSTGETYLRTLARTRPRDLTGEKLLADDAPLTREDLDWFLDLHPDGELLIVFAGPVAADARALCAGHPRVDDAAVTTTVADEDSQVVDWLNAHATVETEKPPTATVS